MHDNLQVVILAGGEGTRLRPLTCDIPKPLVRLLGVPVIERLTALLHDCGMERATVADFYLADKLEKNLGESSNGVSLCYVREDVPLGTAGCVRRAWNGKDDVLVVSGDSVCGFDFAGIARFHSEKNADVTIVTHRVADPREYGLVTADEDGRVTGFLEKPGYDFCLTDVANTGTYVISKEVMNRIPPDEKIDFAKDVFPQLLAENKRLYSIDVGGIWHDIGDIPALLRCQAELLGLEGRNSLVLGSSASQIGDGSVIGANSVIEDGVCMGSDCRVQGACLLSGSIIGDGTSLIRCVVGENAVIGRGCSLGEFSAVGSGCVLGSAVTVDSGVRIAPDVKIPSGTHVRADVSSRGYTPLSLGENGAAEGIALDAVSAMRLGMAVSKALGIKKITVGSLKADSGVCQAVSLGLRAAGTAVYLSDGASFGQTLFVSRALGTDYFLYVRDGIRIINSGRIELARSEERKIEQCYNRGELFADGLAQITQLGASYEAYRQELKRIMPRALNAAVSFEGTDAADCRLFKELADDSAYRGGEKIEFYTADEGGRLECRLDGERVCHESLIILACCSRFTKGEGVLLPYWAPSCCEELAEKYSAEVTRVYPSDKTEIPLFFFDPLMLAAELLGYIARRNISMKKALGELPQTVYLSRTVKSLSNLPRLLHEDFSDLKRASGTDIVLNSSGARAYIRPKKSGKALSLYIEASSAEAADSICEDVFRRLGLSG